MEALLAIIFIVGLMLVIALIPTTIVYFVWNWLAPIYFTGLGEQWTQLPFWHVFGFMVLLSILTSGIRAVVSRDSRS